MMAAAAKFDAQKVQVGDLAAAPPGPAEDEGSERDEGGGPGGAFLLRRG